jgi:hypothetical protein
MKLTTIIRLKITENKIKKTSVILNFIPKYSFSKRKNNEHIGIIKIYNNMSGKKSFLKKNVIMWFFCKINC